MSVSKEEILKKHFEAERKRHANIQMRDDETILEAMEEYASQFKAQPPYNTGKGEMTKENLLKVFKGVSLFDLSECEFEYGDDDLWINAILNGRVIDAISWDGNIFWMMNNDGSFAPLNPMIEGFKIANIQLSAPNTGKPEVPPISVGDGLKNTAKMYSGNEVAKMMKASYQAGTKEIKCHCDNETKTGQTSVMCCNTCGKPDESFWTNK